MSLATALFYIIQIPLHPAGSTDFVVYWATGKQLLHHGNPYDPNLIGSLERSAGLTFPGSYYMRNPPWALPLAVLPGLFPASVGAIPWSLLMVGLLIASVIAVWPVVRGRDQGIALLGYAFPPALQCVFSGQTSLFMLLGIALFLRLHRTRPFWAGASLWFCTLKPHILLPFALIWLVWVLTGRAWRMLAGAAAAMAGSCLLTECMDPSAWSQYLQWSRTSGIAGEKIPCLAVALRDLIDPGRAWIPFAITAAGCLWALIWFGLRRRDWNWIEDGNLVILISLLVAPYSWIWDQCVAIPAVLYGASRTTSTMSTTLLALGYVAVDAQELLGVQPRSDFYLWPAVFWVAWYLLTRSRSKERSGAAPAEAAQVSALG